MILEQFIKDQVNRQRKPKEHAPLDEAIEENLEGAEEAAKTEEKQNDTDKDDQDTTNLAANRHEKAYMGGTLKRKKRFFSKCINSVVKAFFRAVKAPLMKEKYILDTMAFH